MSNYYEWSNFENTYLEDSFVLSIEEFESSLSFIVEVVLTENHPLYSSPNTGEQYCYRKGKIIFQELKSVEWSNRNTQPFTDAVDSEDYGNIDAFILDADGYHLSGDWGEVVVNSSPVKLEWLT